MNDAAAVIEHSREERVTELADAARREQVVADALEAIVVVLGDAPVPVAQYTPIWQAVQRRLHRDALEARARARRAAEHVDDVQAAIEARQRWVDPT